MNDQQQKQRPQETVPWIPNGGDTRGPKSPDVKKPDTESILKKLRTVAPDQSKRYRQRTGE
jgi:hypothetical protein